MKLKCHLIEVVKILIRNFFYFLPRVLFAKIITLNFSYHLHKFTYDNCYFLKCPTVLSIKCTYMNSLLKTIKSASFDLDANLHSNWVDQACKVRISYFDSHVNYSPINLLTHSTQNIIGNKYYLYKKNRPKPMIFTNLYIYIYTVYIYIRNESRNHNRKIM